MTAMLSVHGVAKTFTLHTQGGVRIPVFHDLSLEVAAGECVMLHGPSGVGKSTLPRAMYANILPDTGEIRVRHDGRMIDILSADTRTVLQIRRRTLGYVSQFLRVIPRVSTLDVVAEPLLRRGAPEAEARIVAAAMLERLNIPERLWLLAPATFSGGEQQRVNIAHGPIAPTPALLLDEPTASLDADNRAIVVALIAEAKARGAAIVGIFHDAPTRDAVADRLFDLTQALDAISIGETHKPGRDTFINDSIAGVAHNLEQDILRADHKLHLRCKVVGESVVDLARPHLDNPLVRVVSLMDHTPGQRQWRELSHWLQYHKAEYLPEAMVLARLDKMTTARERFGEAPRREIVALCRARNLIMATHDDTETGQVDEAAREGAMISEFPTTLNAARRAHELGLKTILGSPNVVRGASHSGKVSARELAKEGLLDALSSDYVPVSLLHAAFLLWEEIGLSLPQAAAMVSGNIAKMIGLNDRGCIAPGRRADLLRVKVLTGLPVVRQVWRTGIQVS